LVLDAVKKNEKCSNSLADDMEIPIRISSTGSKFHENPEKNYKGL